MTRAPAIAIGSPPASAMSARPIACATADAIAVVRAPTRSGSRTRHESREHDGRGERGQHRRAAAGALVLEVQDEEAGERRVAEARHEQRDARPHRRPRQRSARARSSRLGAATGSRRSGGQRAATAPRSGDAAANAHTAS